jgi:integrase
VGALHNYVAAVAKFYLINDFSFNIARVKRFMPEEARIKKDRAYSTNEIFVLLQLANERTRAIILLLCSTGMRLGGLAGLQSADLEDKDDIYKITVYRNTNSEYFTYCTPEARRALDIYLEVRKRHGEQFDPKRGGGANPVIREQYNYEDQFSVRQPKPTSVDALEKILSNLLIRSGLRQRIPRTETTFTNRNEISLSRGFRKFFNTQLVSAGVNPLIKEMLMGHRVGLEENYYRPQESAVQAEWEKALDALTINPENRLKRRIQTLEVNANQFDQLAAQIKALEQRLPPG